MVRKMVLIRHYNLASSYIRSGRFEFLSKFHKSYIAKRCVSCEYFGKISTEITTYKNITAAIALVLRDKFGINNSYEELVCTSCRVHILPDYIDRNHEEEYRKAFEWLNCYNSTNVYYESDSFAEEEIQFFHQACFETDEENQLFLKIEQIF